MSYYRKRPITIEARPVPGSKLGRPIMRYADQCTLLAEWCGGISYMMTQDDEKAYEGALVVGPHILIQTLEGPHAALPGDYIIKGVEGEFYPCKPDIFAKTYEEVSLHGN